MSMKMKDDSSMWTVGKYKTKRLDMSKPDSERDSGFSDASSEHLSALEQTDSEDAARLVRPAVPGSRSHPSQMAVVGGSFQSLSPMIIMNNVLLKQPGDNPTALKPWGFSPAVEVVQQPQVVFLQPMVSQGSATVQKGPPSKRRRHKKYLPILKSYPRIAPHPGDSTRNNCTSNSNSSTTSSVKSCNSSSSSQDYGNKQQGLQTSASSGSSTPNHLTPTRHLPKSPPSQSKPSDSNAGSCSSVERSASGRPELTAVATDTQVKSLQAQPIVSKDILCPNSDSDNTNKRKRFCNTYNILSKSGLLDITLRTKELIRLNRRTQAELDQLRGHTNLFVEALQTGDLHMWNKLQRSLESESEKEKTEDTGSETQENRLN